MFHATFMMILTCFIHTLCRYDAFSGTNVLTRCRTASCCFQKSYKGNILGIGQNQRPGSYFSTKLPEDRRRYEVGPRGGDTTRRHGVGPSCLLRLCPSAYLYSPSRKPYYREPRYGKSSRDAAAANPITGDSGDRLRHPAGEGNHHRRALHHHARLRTDA